MVFIKRIRNFVQHGITSYQVKLIAMLFMTIDHVGAYGFNIACINEHYTIFRILGRVSAPLFLYMITESLRYTRSKINFLIRLYVGAVVTNLFIATTNYLFEGYVSSSTISNIIFTYFYVALIIVIIEKLIINIREKNWHCCVGIIVQTVVSLSIIHNVEILLLEYKFSSLLFSNICRSFVKSPMYIEYTPLFILLGVLLYFVGRKRYQIVIFLLFCMASYSYKLFELFFTTPLVSFFGFPQYWMVLAIPFMLLYNGKRGKEHKQLFYIYYPSHILLIKLIASLVIS